MTTLQERLRECAKETAESWTDTDPNVVLMREAADALDRYEQQVRELRAALVHMLMQHTIDRGGPGQHAEVICSHGPILLARSLLTADHPAAPEQQKEV